MYEGEKEPGVFKDVKVGQNDQSGERKELSVKGHGQRCQQSPDHIGSDKILNAFFKNWDVILNMLISTCIV